MYPLILAQLEGIARIKQAGRSLEGIYIFFYIYIEAPAKLFPYLISMRCKECNSKNVFELVKQNINNKKIIGKLYSNIYWCAKCQGDSKGLIETYIK